MSSTAIVVVRADGFGRGQIASAREHREPLEDALLGVEEQVVAPVDDGRQGLLTRQRRARAASEQPEPVVQARRDLLRAATRGCEPRPARWPAAGRRAGHRCQRCEHARHPSAPVARLQPERAATNSLAASPSRERRHRPHRLAADTQRLTARRHESQAGAVAEQILQRQRRPRRSRARSCRGR